MTQAPQPLPANRGVPQPLPDISGWHKPFTGWNIWEDIAESAQTSQLPREPGLGLLIIETGVAAKRILGWAAFFGVIAAPLAGLAFFADDESFVLAIFAFIFLGAALYRVLQWALNYDLKVRIFRGGFTHAHKGATQTVFWRDVESVREHWNKQTINGIQFYTHKLEIRAKNGQTIKLNRSLQEIERVGAIVRAASAENLLPVHLEVLRNEGTLDYGVFKINRHGVTLKGKKYLPWNEVKALEMHTVGTTTIKIQKVGGGALTSSWAAENGGNVPNQNLFITFAAWFVEAAQNPVQPEPPPLESDVRYLVELTQAEARDGVQKTLYVGFPGQEKKLIVRTPAGVKSGEVYRFPDYGRSDVPGKSAGVLHVEIHADDGSARKSSREAFQMALRLIVFIAVMMWLILDSSFDLPTTVTIAAGLGCFSGVLIDVKKRWVGAICGALGGAVSFLLQFVYYVVMNLYFGRERFWNYETLFILLLSLLPGAGLFYLFVYEAQKKPGK